MPRISESEFFLDPDKILAENGDGCALAKIPSKLFTASITASHLIQDHVYGVFSFSVITTPTKILLVGTERSHVSCYIVDKLGRCRSLGLYQAHSTAKFVGLRSGSLAESRVS